ncbi:4Fe-4S single cluster domain-containing protein [Gordonia sp. (in: high G+C Gram-positive bacteria)]|uniref:4Fe-4S single cluster domain-containing protein n=1 Tax=Gordonia sp. (in: high G+C Gram-positive bacteria) TaxID=84139 RepID=UPI0025C69AEB|nr:4Fe-4S single cluster domain-containing protein [Gordonia sp. (in: high G+C Gram-positive bacteria)]HMS75247.1 4Fe-4S single cluster domain-containing protein [Gordonia sp. (in: high G+C Gram-positive bacteria)]HQV20181.1 4Fe-4S single cluster domain-containing protein [Gordonia sp. (in: high G+C Gram-positive bacteria)]
MGAVVDDTVAEGPGRRFAVWVQGCSIRCPGCFNPHLWGPHGGTDIDAGELAARALAVPGIDGVTLLGGEPFEQARPLARFASLVAAQGLSVMTFSGFTYRELTAAGAPDGAAELLCATDLLVSGPYLADRPDIGRPWVGSTNQEFHFLTDRLRHVEAELTALPDRIEVRVAASGEVTVNGWAATDQLDALLADDFRRS